MGGQSAALGAAACLVGLCALVTGGGAYATSDAQERAFVIKDPRIVESSGLASSATLPGVTWTVNDSDGLAQVYGLDRQGRTVATLSLSGATARDWEAVSVGPRSGGRHWIWVGDIGDNLSTWPTVRVYRLAEPVESGDRTVTWSAYDLRYPDGPRNAEALLVDPVTGRLFIVSKRVQGAAVYRLPRTLRTDRVNTLTRVAKAPPLVTDGAFAPDGTLALRDYLVAHVGDRWAARTIVPLPVLPQGESLTWTLDGSALLVGSEGFRSAVWRVPLATVASSPTSAEQRGEEDAVATPEGSPTAFATANNESTSPSPWVIAALGLAVGGGLAALHSTRRRGSRRSGPGGE